MQETPDTESNLTRHTSDSIDHHVPDEVPVFEGDDAHERVVEDFYESYRSEVSDTARATIAGSNPSNVAYASEVDITDSPGRLGDSFTVSLNDVELAFPDAYKTSTKHTYYYGVHLLGSYEMEPALDGWRLTLEYHDASGGGFYRLRVTPERWV